MPICHQAFLAYPAFQPFRLLAYPYPYHRPAFRHSGIPPPGIPYPYHRPHPAFLAFHPYPLDPAFPAFPPISPCPIPPAHSRHSWHTTHIHWSRHSWHSWHSHAHITWHSRHSWHTTHSGIPGIPGIPIPYLHQASFHQHSAHITCSSRHTTHPWTTFLAYHLLATHTHLHRHSSRHSHAHISTWHSGIPPPGFPCPYLHLAFLQAHSSRHHPYP